MRRILLLLLALVSLPGSALAQETVPASAPSPADCQAAAAAGRPLPSGCQPADGSTLQLRQPETIAPQQPQQLTSGRSEMPATWTVVPVNPSERRQPERPVRPQTEFEQVVADTVGRPLPLFGQSLFASPPSTFAPTDHAQVPDDYILGPDDELQLRIWGQLNADLRVTVDRSGQIYIPHVGQIAVAGIRYRELNAHLKAELGKLYRNFDLTVTIGRIRSIQVYVVGRARYPGTYTIGALSTLVNAVFASGGPNAEGSLRDVQVQRDGSTIAHMDLYDLLVKGDKSKDVALRTGDVIYFPPVGPLAAVSGSVNASAIYELKADTDLAELLATAGGLSTVADSGKVTVERIGEGHQRSVLEFPLDAQSRALPLRDGDIVRVFSIVPRFSNSVTLRGNVTNPGRYPWHPGMRIRDLIPNSEALLTRSYWLGRAALTSGRSTEYPIRGARPADSGSQQMPTASGQASQPASYGTGEPDNTGEPSPSSAQESVPPGAGAATAMQRTQATPNSETLAADLHRASPEINWDYAIVQRVDPVDLSTKLLSFNLGKAVLQGDADDNLELQSDDIITIFSQSDIAVPQEKRTQYVRLEGEVRRAGVYKVEEGELLRDVIQRAGGVTSDAYIYGTVLTRESARAEQQASIDELTRALEVDVRQASVAASTRSSPEDAQMIAARQAAQESLIAQMRNLKATGRVVLDLPPSAKTIDAYPAITVEDNDRILIPHRPATVSVTGMVYNPGSFVFDAHNRVGEYLVRAGKGKPNADLKHAFVLHADGTVVGRTAVNSMFTGDKFDDLRLHPGDQIVVPTKIPTGAWVRGLRDWTQITSQLALTGASLAVIH